MVMIRAMDVVSTDKMGDETEVVVEGKSPQLVPEMVLQNRARLRAITVSGLSGVPAETLDQIMSGDLSRVTEINDIQEMRDGSIRYTISVKGGE